MSKVLVIEDEEFISKLISKVVKNKGYDIEIIDNFNQAFELINSNIFDYVLIDYNIDKDKIDSFAKLVKSKNEKCTIILMSGLNEQEINASVQYDKFIFKPDLIDILNKIL